MIRSRQEVPKGESASKIPWLAIIGVVLFCVFLLPPIINFVISRPAPCTFFAVGWTTEEALGFYGAIIGSFVTVLGVYISIQYAQRNYREDVRNKVLPYLVISTVHTKIKFNPIYMLQSSANKCEDAQITPAYEEYKLQKICYIISPQDILVRAELTEEQRAIIENDGVVTTKTSSGSLLNKIDFVSMPLEVENVGKGTAIATRIGLNRIKASEKKYTTPLPLKPNQCFSIHIFSSNVCDGIFGDYSLDFYYEDIYGTRYLQKYPIKINSDIHTGKMYYSIHLSGEQELNPL